jgi:hypothetical protein
MKIVSLPEGIIPDRLTCLLLVLACAGIDARLDAQVSYPITAVTTSTTNSTTSTSLPGITAATGTVSSGLTYTYNFTYGKATVSTGNHVQLDAFVANGFTYTYSGTSPSVLFRRVDINTSTPTPNVVTGKRVSLWYERVASNNDLLTTGGTGNGGTAALIPDYTDVLETLFAGRSFNIGIDNVFQNSNATNNNNIERMDVVFRPGLQATDISKVGFAVFDRGADGSNDPFLIAAIKTVDASGNPASYFPPVSISAASQYGYPLSPGTAVSYHILRKEATETYLKMMTPNQAAQNRNGVFVTFGQLGVPLATTTYGYSLFSPDVTYSTPADLIDWTNASHFPNNTNLSAGGLDMVAVTGVAYTNSALIVLPVYVENFSAVATGSNVQLNWQLGVTDQLKTTVIERSGDGMAYSPILSFSAPSAGPQNAVDDQPLPGKNFYRLKLIGYDGNVSAYSPVCLIDITATGVVSLTIYPNPVKNRQFTLEAQGLKNEGYTLRLLDMSGKLIFSQELSGAPSLKKEILLSGSVSPGTYTVLLADKKGNTVLLRTIVVSGW